MDQAIIRISARDLDTDERSDVVVDAGAPANKAEQRAGLIAAVRALRPDARIRSFADGTATFLDRQHLVVASYAQLPTVRRADPRHDQGSLFGEAA